MKVYRGCKESGLKEMIPRLVNHKDSYVYATIDKVEAVIYSVKGGNFNYTNIYGYDEDGKRCLIERQPKCLENIFNVVGRYYILDGKSFKKHEDLGVGNNEYISTEKVKVLDEITIPNVWNYLKNLEKENKLKIYRYPKRPSLYPQDDSDLIECAIISYLQTNEIDRPFALLEKYHPELKEQIEKVKEYLLSHNKKEIRSNLKFFK